MMRRLAPIVVFLVICLLTVGAAVFVKIADLVSAGGFVVAVVALSAAAFYSDRPPEK